MMWNLLFNNSFEWKIVTFAGGVKTYSDPSYIFSGGQDPHPRIYAAATGNRHEEDLASLGATAVYWRRLSRQWISVSIQQYPTIPLSKKKKKNIYFANSKKKQLQYEHNVQNTEAGFQKGNRPSCWTPLAMLNITSNIKTKNKNTVYNTLKEHVN